MPSVVVFDVNETLSDLGPIASRFADVGAPEHLAKLWFASLLRDGFAITAAGGTERFAALGSGVLPGILAGVTLDRDLDAAIEHIMAGFRDLPLHPDVVAGVTALHDAGFRLVTLTNGSTEISENLFARAGIRDRFEKLLSVEDVGTWKPGRAAYEYAARKCDTDRKLMLLVAVHPWDIDGAARAGMATAWLNRNNAQYPPHFRAPTYIIGQLPDLAKALAA